MAEAETTTFRRLEWWATALLALAAVATAWSSYQAARWNGEQAKAASQTNAVRVQAARAQGEAEAQTEVDVATFIQWVDANARDDDELAAFYEARFRDELQPAFAAWLATDPFENPDAPPTPFAMDEYDLAAQDRVEELDAQEQASAATVRTDIQRATNYVLGVVLFAVALFFAGISTKLDGVRPRTVMVVVGWLFFVATVAWVATFPISFSV